MAKQDYYQILGVNRGANAGDIKRAYYRLAMQFHPDHNPGNKTAEARFKDINEAHDVLKDDQKRAAYDQFGHAAFEVGSRSQSTHANTDDAYATKSQCDYIIENNSPIVITIIADVNALYGMSPKLFIEKMTPYFIDTLGLNFKTAKDWLKDFLKRKPELASFYLNNISSEHIAKLDFCNELWQKEADIFIEKMSPYYIRSINTNPNNLKTDEGWLLGFLKQKPDSAAHYIQEILPAIISKSELIHKLYKLDPSALIEKMTPYYTNTINSNPPTAQSARAAEGWLVDFLDKKPEIAIEIWKGIHGARLRESPQLLRVLEAIPPERAGGRMRLFLARHFAR